MIKVKTELNTYITIDNRYDSMLKKLTPYGQICDYYFEVDFEKLKQDYEELTGVSLVLVPHSKITPEAYGVMTSRNEIPFSTSYDHDLLVHVLPTVGNRRFNLKPLFQEAAQIKNDTNRGYVFEFINALEIGAESQTLNSLFKDINKVLSSVLKNTDTEDRDFTLNFFSVEKKIQLMGQFIINSAA